MKQKQSDNGENSIKPSEIKQRRRMKAGRGVKLNLEIKMTNINIEIYTNIPVTIIHPSAPNDSIYMNRLF